ncbi:MAG: hypothetical protein Q7V63_01795 [Gammaproteobacteria bacterium]|nr:hypothetical protein [Gammaproteobacteria bacterium]
MNNTFATYRERAFAQQVNFLNAEMRRDGFETTPTLDAVMEQADKEYFWFADNYFNGSLNESERSLYYNVAFCKALEAMYSPNFLDGVNAKWMVPEYQEVFDKISVASRERTKLVEECKNIHMALTLIRTEAEKMCGQGTATNSHDHKEYDAFMDAHTTVLAEVSFYYKRQALHITNVGQMSAAVANNAKANCMQSLKEAMTKVSNSPSWEARLSEVAVIVCTLGIANIIKGIYTGSCLFFNQIHSAAKLSEAAQMVQRG